MATADEHEDATRRDMVRDSHAEDRQRGDDFDRYLVDREQARYERWMWGDR